MSDDRKSWVEDPSRLQTVIDSVKQENGARLLMDKTLLRLYYQRPVASVPDPLRPYQELSTFETLQQLGFNLTREVIDASAARMCRPLKCNVAPAGTDFETRRQCEMLTKLVDGILDASGWLEEATQAWIDCSTTTIGAVKWFVEPTTKEIKCEKIDPLSVLWHYDEGRHPAHLYLEYPAAKSTLAAQFPEHAAAIEQMSPWRIPIIVGVEAPGIRGTDTVRVCEAWERKIGDHVGHHTITCGDAVLADEPWDYDFFPLAFFRWSPDFRGFGGVPGARIIAPYHIWSNSLVRMVYDSLKGAVPWVLRHEDDILNNISDVPYQEALWSGAHRPEIVKNEPVSTQAIQWIGELRMQAHAEFGMNKDAAAGTRPTGLNSAPSQRAWVELVDGRMARQQRNWEAPWNESARIIVALASEAYKSKAARVKAPGTAMIEEIKWPAKLKEDQYRMTFALSSGLSTSLSARMEELAQLRDRGAIDEADYLARIDLPDVAAIADRVNAPRRLAEKQISEALNDCVFRMPSALQGEQLDAIVKIGTQEWQRAELSGSYPAENMECLRRLIKAADARRKGLAAPPPSLPAPVPAVLPGQPAGVSPMPSSVLPPQIPIETQGVEAQGNAANDNAVAAVANDNAVPPVAQEGAA